MTSLPPPETIVTGGQTGADRAALDWALRRGWAIGGWCPAGRAAEDGRIPDRYPLRETSEAAPIARTWANVHDSDATLIFSLDPALAGGTLDTLEIARSLDRPVCVLARDSPDLASDFAELEAFLLRHRPLILNVAGPRSSEAPGIEKWVEDSLDRIFPRVSKS